MWFSANVYGWRFASLVPLRMLWGNWINCAAAINAIFRHCRAKWRGEPLRWVKTAHNYPSREALREHKRTLEQVLIGAGYFSEDELAGAAATKPRGVLLADHLLRSGMLDEEQLVEALALMENLPIAQIGDEPLPRHALPERVVREWQVLPIRIEQTALHVAVTSPPLDALDRQLRRFTSLEVRYHLTTRSQFAAAIRNPPLPRGRGSVV
jgi:hypothetical protein